MGTNISGGLLQEVIQETLLSRCFILQKCDHCNTPFCWSEIYKSFVWTYKPIECNNCGTEHRITILGRLSFVLCTIVPAMIFMNFLSPFDNFILTFVILISILLGGSLLTPFFVKYKGEV
ncbi:TIGR04104 family putative zinc finger protein [Rossellomorea sp. NRS-1567]|uniref:TIGR04104 family putative zinc finger protein n=1 Tax=Rossellomorea sp. NRS-1567 TaxID=3233901 RepID=UPI003D2DEE9A